MPWSGFQVEGGGATEGGGRRADHRDLGQDADLGGTDEQPGVVFESSVDEQEQIDLLRHFHRLI